MKEQSIIIENIKSFEPKQVFECGQCFRWNEEEDRSYTGILGNNVLNVKKESDLLIIKGICNSKITEIVQDYFDLNRDYEQIKCTLSKVDENIAESIKYGEGIRLLNQDLWETLISFIISANNNIPRIKKIIETLAKKYGKPINWQGKTYYTFPTSEELKDVSIQEFREAGLGFRDKYVADAVRKVNTKELNLRELYEIKDTSILKEKLMSVQGVGEKVADCVMLFSDLKRLDAFPIDVWVRRVMRELYFPDVEEKKLDRKQIEELAKKKYSNLAGIAQQYLFYWKREA